MSQLTSNFWLHEFTRSDYAERHQIDMTAPDWVQMNLTRLCLDLLEPIRAILNRPIYITSGYRPPALNEAIRGAANSKHMQGNAADFVVAGIDLKTAARIIAALPDLIPFDQLIFEHNWLHIQQGRNKPRNQVLTAHFDGNAVKYSNGVT